MRRRGGRRLVSLVPKIFEEVQRHDEEVLPTRPDAPGLVIELASY
jgi:hypothetical protein